MVTMIMNIITLTKVVASEQSEWWLSVHDILHFLPHNDPTQVGFSQHEPLSNIPLNPFKIYLWMKTISNPPLDKKTFQISLWIKTP